MDIATIGNACDFKVDSPYDLSSKESELKIKSKELFQYP